MLALIVRPFRALWLDSPPARGYDSTMHENVTDEFTTTFSLTLLLSWGDHRFIVSQTRRLCRIGRGVSSCEGWTAFMVIGFWAYIHIGSIPALHI